MDKFVLVSSCVVMEGDSLIHPIVIRYEKGGQQYERLTSAEEVLSLFEKREREGYVCPICGSTEPNIHRSGGNIPRH